MAYLYYDVPKLLKTDSQERLRIIERDYQNTKQLQSLYKAIFETILRIHGLRQNRKSLRVYIGRSYAGKGVLGRWRMHHADKGLRYALIVGKCRTEIIENVESSVLRFLKLLEENYCLCVGELENATRASFGPLPDTTHSLIYLCFDTDSDGEFYGVPSTEELKDFADDLIEEDDFNPRSIREVLSLTRAHNRGRPSRPYPH